MKTRFRTLILACVIASPLAHAGIPVAVDADPMRDVQWAQELKRWMKRPDTTSHKYRHIKTNWRRPLAFVILLILLTRPKA
ncbi:type IV secretion system VirB5 component [Klebsiella pneumoniae]|uniref:Type IV secretion system VirB5 component n=1 Tax=Klebsiella pneumoniae TaxID=573 RepID=A0A378AD33_KLEPN|nr:type IV secretion system VirB5 component [Klebsiella pneumoniae]